MNAVGHWRPTVACETCNIMFHSQGDADKHMQMLGHWKNYCKTCGRRFQNDSNLRAHLNSKIHRGTKVSCTFRKATFVLASGVSHHLETGSCPKAKNLNRQTIHRMLQQSDVNGFITNKQSGWHDEVHLDYSVTDQAYNGDYWE